MLREPDSGVAEPANEGTDNYRAKALQLLEQVDRENDEALKLVYAGVAGAFAMLAKRAKLKANLKGTSGTEPRLSRSGSYRTHPITIGASRSNSDGCEREGLVPRQHSACQPTPARSAFRLTSVQSQVVLEAYAQADAARKSVADCYRAGVDALYQLYPDVPRELVAAEAVKILTAERSRQLSHPVGNSALSTSIGRRRAPESPTQTVNGRGRSMPKT